MPSPCTHSNEQTLQWHLQKGRKNRYLKPLMWFNFHTHSEYCDGKTSLQELLKEASSRRLLSLGFSSHAPLPFNKAWAMKESSLAQYLAEISDLRRQSGTVEVYAGLEVDYVPGKISPDRYAAKLDFTIGSVHFVDYFEDGEPWEIDNTSAVFADGLKRIFHGNVKDAVSRYYELTREMIDQHPPTIVGHIDKIKMQNTAGMLFREDEPWYRDEIEKTIKVLKRSDTIVEVNTRGIYQKKFDETYPSEWILEILFKNNIPVTISSDAHHPKDLINCFQIAAAELSKAGYKVIQVLHEGKWKPFRFNESGLVDG
jgi:histidinol-phosphatase (PHP family)